MEKMIVKSYDELNLNELYQILKVRSEVFVVEQNCPYLDIDGKDQMSIHVMLKEDEEIVGYVRVYPSNVKLGYGQIGRVLSTKRKKGIGARVFQEGINICHDILHTDHIYIEAQEYAIPFYQRFGFKQDSEIFLEDNIPHVQMTYTKK